MRKGPVAFLEREVTTRIIEGILPDAGLARVRGTWSSEVSVEQEMGREIIFERRPDGTVAPAHDEIQAASPNTVYWLDRFSLRPLEVESSLNGNHPHDASAVRHSA